MMKSSKILLWYFSFSVLLVSFSYASDVIEQTGNFIKVILPVTAIGLSLYKNDYEGLFQFTESFLTTITITYGLKYSIKTTRPNGEPHSFPSGHTSIAFSGASFLQKRYGWKYGIPAYAAAAFIGYSRLEANKHYFRDILAGAIIGTASSYLFTDVYSSNKMSFIPVVENKSFIMLFNLRFY
ncbi:phosphoesterase PA-phosphatase related protein [Thermodesulfatator indicus DSM 15286]|uniref:Phosphoesterase PA-phosphatase related protein n=1 Tax=Thermodesulfatator indicus (strain DSM 15286 / JCM 11887 / CIR29812) TaxID=667014 RepID=F8ADA1_THEID|nr:phosphatase PAP2 family protein [Thermodesulfatator indicus]AEH44840.1 phosphoesterase PA-phosphatase related protein [Thermodesulfatator indicus DSM 15286]